MRQKKWILIVLMVVMALSLSGCGLFDTMLSLSEGKPTSYSSAYD